MARLQQDEFRIFISHKHADKELANVVARELEELAPGQINCWVSGQELTAGVDWDRHIKKSLADSHLLILLFTTPAHVWDWCLFEVGLFLRFDAEDTSAVVCLLDPQGTPPGPLGQVQGVHADPDQLVTRFLRPLCVEPWTVSDDWQRGALRHDVDDELLTRVATRIADEFRKTLASVGDTDERYVYHPCHRIVLDLSTSTAAEHGTGIPLDAQVVLGPEHTTSYTLSLFHVHEGRGSRTWGDLVSKVDASENEWQADLDRAVDAGLRGELWEPSAATLLLTHPGSHEPHRYLPVLSEIVRRRSDDAPVGHDPPVGMTIMLVPRS